ncbi:MAG: L-histidine N(alpha)-methyltransferase [Burkholderiales bacterium]|nr:L-histidine N(alpha)-methyltransferase [Burkholderiales bacterium]
MPASALSARRLSSFPADAKSSFAADFVAGLARRPRRIPPKHFYDAEGSRLFDRICELPEYYPTRTELRILADHAPEMAAQIGPHAEIVEFGAGSLVKIRLLLDALDAPRRYLPIDISGEHLNASAVALRADHPDLIVQPIIADYTRPFALPPRLDGTGRRIGFFPGSTIGNFDPDDALAFLTQAGRLLRGGGLLLGFDLVKGPEVLHAAYNDAQGVTAAFNLNLLARANAELGADFDLDAFDHAAFYNAPLRRVEMHLVSRRAQSVRVNGRCYAFDEGETVHTENSHKFTLDGLRAMATQAGFGVGPAWTDPERLFCVHWLTAPTA